jgi:hypothetical protein
VWLRTWDPFCEGVPLTAYKKGEATVSQTKLSDGKILSKIRRQTIPEETRKELLDWSRKTVNESRSVLHFLFTRYRISPIVVLDVIGSWKAYFVKFQETLKVAAHIRSARLRKKHAKTLKNAAEILKLWQPLIPYATSSFSYPHSNDVEMVAKTLLQFGAAQAYRPQEVEIKRCAQDLKRLLYNRTKRPLYRYIGELMLIAFPGQWNPAGDVREATKKLVKGRQQNGYTPFCDSTSLRR